MIRLVVRPRMLRVMIAARLLGARLRYVPTLEPRGRWTGQEILLGPRTTAAVVLHELGHHVYGFDCCREHEEFASHGIGLFLARLLRVPYEFEHQRMTWYVGWSASCPREDIRRGAPNWIEPDACTREAPRGGPAPIPNTWGRA